MGTGRILTATANTTQHIIDEGVGDAELVMTDSGGSGRRGGSQAPSLSPAKSPVFSNV